MHFNKLVMTFLTSSVVGFSPPVLAHEFWLDAIDYTVEAGHDLQVEIKVGQDFKGNTYSFNPNLFYDFSVTDSSGKHPIEGRIGDSPAVSMVPANSGLLVLNHFSTSQLLTYKDDGKFEDFVESKGLDWVLDAHAERGLPKFGFGEGYTRFAKSLIAVGDGAGRDGLTGMPIELVALKNPYTDDLSEGFPVRLMWENAGLANIQVDIFRRPKDGGDVQKTHVRTDESGLAIIPVVLGDIYLIDAVHMIIPAEADIERTGAVWHSLWASMTFEVVGTGE